MTTLRVHTLFKRPNTDVLLGLGFKERLEEFLELSLRPGTKSLVLVTSPSPYDYGSYQFHPEVGFFFSLRSPTTPGDLRKIANSLVFPLEAMVRFQNTVRGADKTLTVMFSGDADETTVRKLTDALAAAVSNAGLSTILIVPSH